MRDGCGQARRAPALVDPALGVDGRKQAQLRRVAEAYLALEKPACRECRFDVVSVLVSEDGIEIRRMEGAF